MKVMLCGMKIKKYHKGVFSVENTLNSQEQIQKTKEELVLDELCSYCSASEAPLVVKLFKIRRIFNNLDEIKYPRYFLHMLNEKSAAEERMPNWCEFICRKIGAFYSDLGFVLQCFLLTPLSLLLGSLAFLLLIFYLLARIKAKIIYAFINFEVKLKSSRDETLYETALHEQFFQTIDNSISDVEIRSKIKSLYNEIMSERKQNGRPDDKLFGELLSNEVYQKNLLCIMELICTTLDRGDCDLFRDILSKKTTDSLLEFCRKFDSGANTKNLKIDIDIDIDKMMLMHENANEVILSSISNTCKSGDVFSANTSNVDSDFYISDFDAKFECINECTELIKYFQRKKLQAGKIGEKIKRICRGIEPNKDFWSKVRDRFGLNVFNMCIRGKGSDDTSRIDIDPTNNLLARLNNGLHGNDKLKIYTTASGTYFLFDQVSKSKNGDYEVMHYRNSVLNDNGKRITERVLNLFLPPDYKLENQDEKFVVRKTEQSKYEKIANKIDEINKLFDIYQDKEIKCKKLANRYKKDKDAVNEQTMRQKAKEYEQAKNKIFSELEERLNEWQLEFCPNGYPDLPDSELDFRKKLKSDTDSYEKVRECFRKTFKLSVNDINKNIFDDMLATILYRYIATIHQASDIYPDAAERNTFMNALRKQFGGECSNGKLDSYALGTITERSVKYFKYLDEMETVRQGMCDASKYKLPEKFFEYNENDEDCMCTALNYIQVLIQSAIAVMKIDAADTEIRIRFNRNANKLKRIFENGTEEANYYQELKTKIEESILNNPDDKRQEIFVKLLLDGVMDYSENQIQEICDMALKFTDFDLDNPTREHVTQINCVRAEKDEQGNLVGCKFDTKGMLSVEVSDDFQPPDLQEEPREDQDNNHMVNLDAIENLFRDLFESLRETRAVLNEPIPEPIPRIAGNMHNHMYHDV